MKIALAHEILHKFGGAERVLKVFCDMFPNAPIYTLLYDEKKLGQFFPKKRIITTNIQKYFKYIKHPQPFLSMMPKAVEEFNFKGFDLVLSSSSAFMHGIITPLETKHICYCHSPMRYSWDYTNEYIKEHFSGILSPIKKFLITKILKKIREWDQISCDRPDIYISNSKNVQKRLIKYYKIKSNIIYPPVDTERFSIKQEKDNYYLIVSALSTYKKIDLAIKAFNRLSLPLYIIGEGNQKKYLQSISNKNISFLGRLDDKETKIYMENAKGFIFPGEDDFGITPLEAISCGTPVLAYKKGGSLETVIEGKTGEFFDKQTIESFLTGIKKIEANSIHYNKNMMRQHAHKFATHIFKHNIFQTINKVMLS